MNETLFNLPNPIDILIDPVSLIVYAIFGSLFIWEQLFPARDLPKIKYWKIKGLLFFVIFMLLTTYFPLLWDGFFASYQLMDLSSLSLTAQFFIGIFLFELVQYGWHVSMHKSDFLFRVSHQIHHSSERLDVPSAFMFSINDMIGISLIGSVCFALIMGLDPKAITIIILATTFFGVFQHANINTPQWIGYFIQRPESHSVHHGRGIHKNNYTDLPLIDMIFGTFQNPKSYQKETGFYDGASSRIKDMFLFRDVSKPKNNN